MRRYSPYNHFTLFCLHPGKKKRFYLSSFHNFLNRFYPGLSCESFSSIFFFYKTRAEINRRKICILYFLLSFFKKFILCYFFCYEFFHQLFVCGNNKSKTNYLLSRIDDIITFWHPLQKKLFIFFRCSNLPSFSCIWKNVSATLELSSTSFLVSFRSTEKAIFSFIFSFLLEYIYRFLLLQKVLYT